jgi:ribosomal protein L18E
MLTRNAIGNLLNRYRSVLRKCALLNAIAMCSMKAPTVSESTLSMKAPFLLGASLAVGTAIVGGGTVAYAEATDGQFDLTSTNLSYSNFVSTATFSAFLSGGLDDPWSRGATVEVVSGNENLRDISIFGGAMYYSGNAPQTDEVASNTLLFNSDLKVGTTSAAMGIFGGAVIATSTAGTSQYNVTSNSVRISAGSVSVSYPGDGVHFSGILAGGIVGAGADGNTFASGNVSANNVVITGSALVTADQIFGGVTWNGGVSENYVEITGPDAHVSFYEGIFGGVNWGEGDATSAVEGNYVVISGGAHVENMEGGRGWIIGGWQQGSSGNVINNSVYISSGNITLTSGVENGIIGGFSYEDIAASGNNVTIYEANISAQKILGASIGGSSILTHYNNSVHIVSGYLSGVEEIGGVKAKYGNASANNIFISGADLSDSPNLAIAGAYVESGQAGNTVSDNTVTLKNVSYGGKFTGDAGAMSGYIVGGAIFNSGAAINNSVYIESMTFSPGASAKIVGGFAGVIAGESVSAVSNSVILNNTDISAVDIFGGLTYGPGENSGNRVLINSGNVHVFTTAGEAGVIAGGYAWTSTGKVEVVNNEVIISNDAKINASGIRGGVADVNQGGSASVTGNSVIISGGAIENNGYGVMGGYINASGNAVASAYVGNNEVLVSGGKFTDTSEDIFGGFIDGNGSAVENKVVIRGGNFSGQNADQKARIIGGYVVGSGSATGNDVTVADGNFSGQSASIIGGYLGGSGQVTGNSAVVAGGNFSGQTDIFGGYVDSDGSATQNIAYVSGGNFSGQSANIIGGYVSGSGNVTNNQAGVAYGNFSGQSASVIGGYLSGSGQVTGNSAVVAGGNFSGQADIFGGYVDSDGSATQNIAYVSGGEFTSSSTNIIGGYVSGSGNVANNRVGVAEGNFSGQSASIIGGYLGGSGQVSGNSAVVAGGNFSGQTDIFGGYVDSDGSATQNLAYVSDGHFTGQSANIIGGYVSGSGSVDNNIVGVAGNNFSARSATIIGGYLAGSGHASANSAVVAGGNFSSQTDIFGGYVDNDGSATENMAYVAGGNFSGQSANIVGGYVSGNGEATSNQLVVTGGNFTAQSANMAAGYLDGSGLASGNIAAVLSGNFSSKVDIFGGYIDNSGSAIENNVHVAGGNFTGQSASIVGGYLAGSGHASANEVLVENGKFSSQVDIFGGYVDNDGSANENAVNVLGGEFSGKSTTIVGGYVSGDGDATSNTLVVAGGTFAGSSVEIIGGYVSGSGSATSNTITLKGRPEFKSGTVVSISGGVVTDPSGDDITGNRLEFEAYSGSKITEVNNFDTMHVSRGSIVEVDQVGVRTVTVFDPGVQATIGTFTMSGGAVEIYGEKEHPTNVSIKDPLITNLVSAGEYANVGFGTANAAQVASMAATNGATLVIDNPITIGNSGGLSVNAGEATTVGQVLIGSNTTTYINQSALGNSPAITGATSGSVRDGAKLVINNIKDAYKGTTFTVLDPTTGNINIEGNAWSVQDVTLFSDDTSLALTFDKSTGQITAKTSTMGTQMDPQLILQVDSDPNSKQAGVRFKSRAWDRGYLGSDRATAAKTVESAARAATLAAAPQLTRVASNASMAAATQRLSLANPTGSGMMVRNENGTVNRAAGDMSNNGLAMWIMPLYQSHNATGMKAGNYKMDWHGALGGVAVGGDFTMAGTVRVGINASIGGGYSEGSGELAKTTNDFSYWGIGAYGGFAVNHFAAVADINYTGSYSAMRQSLPEGMRMSDLKAEIQGYSLSTGVKLEYKVETRGMDIIPHAGVRYMHLATRPYDLKSGGDTVLHASAVHQDIWTFPMGIAFVKEVDMGNGWTVKPSADFIIIPAAGDVEGRSKVRFTGENNSADLRVRVMDYTAYQGIVGLEVGKDNVWIGLNYTLILSEHTASHGVFGTARVEF